jgi:hypothetical protein
MRRIGYVLIMLVAIVDVGCAPKGDWISGTLTLVNLTGTWEGTVEGLKSFGGPIMPARSMRLRLQQRGARVTGEAEAGGRAAGRVDGLVQGDVFTFQWGEIRGEAAVDEAEMKGQFDGYGCPCSIVLHRSR